MTENELIPQFENVCNVTTYWDGGAVDNSRSWVCSGAWYVVNHWFYPRQYKLPAPWWLDTDYDLFPLYSAKDIGVILLQNDRKSPHRRISAPLHSFVMSFIVFVCFWFSLNTYTIWSIIFTSKKNSSWNLQWANRTPLKNMNICWYSWIPFVSGPNSW